MSKPPSKELFLRMAELSFSAAFSRTRSHQLGWMYLFCWAMHEHWIENYWEDV
jgi:hypothetical protein